MTRAKMFGHTVVGHGASAAQAGGLVAERNRAAAEFADALDLFAALLFAYLPKWQRARRLS